jgi:hypothetical protein
LAVTHDTIQHGRLFSASIQPGSACSAAAHQIDSTGRVVPSPFCPSAFHTQFSAELPLFLSFSVSGGMMNERYGITGPHIVQEMEISQPFWLDDTIDFW